VLAANLDALQEIFDDLQTADGHPRGFSLGLDPEY